MVSDFRFIADNSNSFVRGGLAVRTHLPEAPSLFSDLDSTNEVVAFHGWVLSIWNVFWTLAIGHYRPGR
jgi:hypothetical protein